MTTSRDEGRCSEVCTYARSAPSPTRCTHGGISRNGSTNGSTTSEFRLSSHMDPRMHIRAVDSESQNERSGSACQQNKNE
jgi:hypothetical protein